MPLAPACAAATLGVCSLCQPAPPAVTGRVIQRLCPSLGGFPHIALGGRRPGVRPPWDPSLPKPHGEITSGAPDVQGWRTLSWGLGALLCREGRCTASLASSLQVWQPHKRLQRGPPTSPALRTAGSEEGPDQSLLRAHGVSAAWSQDPSCGPSAILQPCCPSPLPWLGKREVPHSTDSRSSMKSPGARAAGPGQPQ